MENMLIPIAVVVGLILLVVVLLALFRKPREDSSAPEEFEEPEERPSRKRAPAQPAKRPAEEAPGNEDLANDDAHMHRYLFQHRLLPTLISRDPAQVWELFSGPKGQSFIEDMWNHVGEMLGRSSKPKDRPRFTMEGGEDFLAILFHHPKPTQATQCYFSALVWTKPPDEVDDKNLEEVMHPLRYYTLEQSVSLSGEPETTMLCGWDVNDKGEAGTHFNYGPGPRPDSREFLRAIARLLQG
jgi:hypothetical protein